MSSRQKISLWGGLIIFVGLIFFFSNCQRKRMTSEKVIRFLDLGTPEEIARMNPLLREFEKLHPGVKVKPEYAPGCNEIRQKLLMESAAGLTPDVVYLNDTYFPEFIKRGIFVSLDSLINKDKEFNIKDFQPKALEIARFNTDKLYSLPPNFGTLVIFYNKRMFKEAGLVYPKDGWSWKEFREVCKRLTKKDKTGKIVQFALTEWGLWSWIPMILQNEGQIINKEGKCVLNSPEVLEALQFCKDLYTKDKVIASSLTFPSITQMSSYEFFSGERAAMLLGEISISFQIAQNINWDIVAPPEKEGGKKYFHCGFWAYAITSDSKDKDLAWELVKFLTSEKAQRETLQGIKEGKYRKFLVIGMPTRIFLEKEFPPLFPDKHLSSYTYALSHLPDFFQAQYIGTYPINEILNRYSIQDNLEGITKDNLKDLLDKITKEVNLAIQKD